MSENKSANTVDAEKGMEVYEYIVNNVDTCVDEMDTLCNQLCDVDNTGQFLSSTARFLAAVDKEKFAPFLPGIIEAAIGKDRERRYIGQLLEAIWGEDYKERSVELSETDNVFRRLYKRVYPTGIFG